MDNDTPNLNSAYALETPEDNVALYADWAATYESTFVDDTGYILHLAVADAFVAARGQGPVLDVGAGTGLCGVALRRHGVSQIQATDISSEMLEVAATKNAYDTAFQANILEGLPVDDGCYNGVVSSGTFTLGHVGPAGLDEVMRILAPGGLAVISVRDVHFEDAGFAKKLNLLGADIARISRTITRIYAPGSTADHSEDRAILLHIWKT